MLNLPLPGQLRRPESFKTSEFQKNFRTIGIDYIRGYSSVADEINEIQMVRATKELDVSSGQIWLGSLLWEPDTEAF